MNRDEHPLDPKLQKAIDRLEKEIGPNFDRMPPEQLLRIAASNSFESAKTAKEIRLIVTVIGIVAVIIAIKILGFS